MKALLNILNIKKLFLAIIALALFTGQIPEDEFLMLKKEYVPYKESVNFLPINGNFIPYLDTIYVLGNHFVEISLKDQMITLHTRNQAPQYFPVSTGNKYVKAGISTPTGIFTVQTRSRAEISEEFDDAVMLNWIGFNFNVGIHALEKKHYYPYLGKRPSSHGCVRISQEDAKTLYENVKIGTPVMVYDEPPARILAFGNFLGFDYKKDMVIANRDRSIQKVLADRLVHLRTRDDLHKIKRNIFLDSRTILYRTIDIISINDIAPTREEGLVLAENLRNEEVKKVKASYRKK